jgi:hypothetical protein
MANGRGIENAVELEQRLTRIEGKIDAQGRRLEQYIEDHTKFASRELKRNEAQMALMCNQINVNTESRIQSRERWENHRDEHANIGRKERIWDVIIGAFAAISAAIWSQLK